MSAVDEIPEQQLQAAVRAALANDDMPRLQLVAAVLDRFPPTARLAERVSVTVSQMYRAGELDRGPGHRYRLHARRRRARPAVRPVAPPPARQVTSPVHRRPSTLEGMARHVSAIDQLLAFPDIAADTTFAALLRAERTTLARRMIALLELTP